MGKGTAADRALRRRAAELDRLKEEIGHYKLWEGASAAIGSALAGWLVSTADHAAPLTFALGVAGVIFTGTGMLFMYGEIRRRIERIGKL